MTENVVLHIMLRHLERILPLENWRFIQQEGQKLLLAFEGVYHDDWDLEHPRKTPAIGDCIDCYHIWRPITIISDTYLILVIRIRFVSGYLPLDTSELFRCLEQGILMVRNSSEIDFSEQERERQMSETNSIYPNYISAATQSERMSQLEQDPRSIQCP